MSLHLQRQINHLKKMILAVGAQVEEAVQLSIRAIESRDTDLAEQVIDNDRQIDLTEVEIEEECLHTLALHQPVAFDLRYVIATLKINGELERIGDLAVNVAQFSQQLAEFPPLDDMPFDLKGMTSTVRNMVKQSLDALVNIDPEIAEQVRQLDDQVDAIHRSMYQKVEQAIRSDPELVQVYVQLLGVSRNLERMADHAVNVAEHVIYMAKGDILRHHRPHPFADV